MDGAGGEGEEAKSRKQKVSEGKKGYNKGKEERKSGCQLSPELSHFPGWEVNLQGPQSSLQGRPHAGTVTQGQPPPAALPEP